MADERPNFIPRRRPGQTYTPPSQEERDAQEDKNRASDPRVTPRIDPRAANLTTPEADTYRTLANALSYVDDALGTELGKAHQQANMAAVDKKFQANLTQMQNNLDELAKTDRNLAFAVADAVSDGVRTNQNKVDVALDGKSTNVAEVLANALGQDTLDGIKNLFNKQEFAFTDVSSGKTVTPSSNAVSDTKLAERSAPEAGRS